MLLYAAVCRLAFIALLSSFAAVAVPYPADGNPAPALGTDTSDNTLAADTLDNDAAAAGWEQVPKQTGWESVPTIPIGPCNIPLMTRDMFEQGAKEQLRAWALRSSTSYLKRHLVENPSWSERDRAFQHYLSQTWFPNLEPGISHCDGQLFCSQVSCEYLTPNATTDDKKYALWAFRMFDNWYQHMQNSLKDAETAVNDAHLGIDTLVTTFTDASKLKTALANSKNSQQKKVQTANTVVLVVAGLLGIVGTIAGNPMAGAAAGAVMTGSVTMYQVYSGLWLGMSGQNANTRKFDFEPSFTFHVEASQFIQGINRLILDSITNQTIAVIKGVKDSAEQPLMKVLEDPQWIDRRLYDRTRLAQFNHRLRALIINHLWADQWVYIVMADAKGNCLSDNRIYAPTKVCLKQYPQKTFQLLFMGWEKEGRGGKSKDVLGMFSSISDPVLMRGPPGYTSLGKGDYAAITKEMVVLDSLNNYRHNGYKMHLADQGNLLEKMVGGNFPDPHLLTGIFSVPVIDNPSGESLSSIMEKDGRHYPLTTGGCSWQKITKHCNDQWHDFLDVMGMSASDDLEQFAREMFKVTWDTSVNWKFATNNGGRQTINHPILTIGKPPRIGATIGHEDPKDDGTKEHGDADVIKGGKCKGKHLKKGHGNSKDDDCPQLETSD